MQWREPVQIAQGDTIQFQRSLELYPPANGWSLIYAMRGGAQAIEFVSAAVDNYHQVYVAPAVTELWLPGDYTLEGWATNGVDRFPIYLAQLKVTPDLATAPGDVVVKTHAQRMLQGLEKQLEALAQNVLDRTNVEGTEIQRVQRKALYELRAKYLRERQSEIARERAQSGRPSGRKLNGVFRIVQPGSPAPQIFQGNSVYNNQTP